MKKTALAVLVGWLLAAATIALPASLSNPCPADPVPALCSSWGAARGFCQAPSVEV